MASETVTRSIKMEAGYVPEWCFHAPSPYLDTPIPPRTLQNDIAGTSGHANEISVRYQLFLQFKFSRPLEGNKVDFTDARSWPPRPLRETPLTT